jgi:galactonate dehydratase
MAAVPNFFLQEFIASDVAWRDEILNQPLPIEAGAFSLSDSPGLGFDLVEEQLERHPGVTTPRPGFYI